MSKRRWYTIWPAWVAICWRLHSWISKMLSCITNIEGELICSTKCMNIIQPLPNLTLFILACTKTASLGHMHILLVAYIHLLHTDSQLLICSTACWSNQSHILRLIAKDNSSKHWSLSACKPSTLGYNEDLNCNLGVVMKFRWDPSERCERNEDWRRSKQRYYSPPDFSFYNIFYPASLFVQHDYSMRILYIHIHSYSLLAISFLFLICWSQIHKGLGRIWNELILDNMEYPFLMIVFSAEVC